MRSLSFVRVRSAIGFLKFWFGPVALLVCVALGTNSCRVMEKQADASTTVITPVAVDSSFQPPVTYTRPLKFPTLQILTNVALTDTTPFQTVPIDVHAYQSAVISYVPSNVNCQFMPLITVSQGPTSTFTGVDISAANANYSGAGNITEPAASYNLALSQNFIIVQMVGTPNLTGFRPCAFNIYITLVPDPLPVSSATVVAIDHVVSVNSNPAVVVNSTAGTRSITLQNQGTSVIDCNLVNGTQFNSVDGGTTRILAAGLVNGDGAGGSTTYENWGGTVYCFAPSGGGTLGITAY